MENQHFWSIPTEFLHNVMKIKCLALLRVFSLLLYCLTSPYCTNSNKYTKKITNDKILNYFYDENRRLNNKISKLHFFGILFEKPVLLAKNISIIIVLNM
jgi:hypothetical protein